jgi:hypothetical protein
VQEPGIARSDLQQNVRLLSKLSTPLHAVTGLLASHEQSLELFLKNVRSSAGINSDDFELLGTISQRVFGALSLHDKHHICWHNAARKTAVFWPQRASKCTSAQLARIPVLYER